MDTKEKLNVEYPDIYPTLLKTLDIFLKPARIFNCGRKFSECANVFL